MTECRCDLIPNKKKNFSALKMSKIEFKEKNKFVF